jgi:hypothetical protein
MLLSGTRELEIRCTEKGNYAVMERWVFGTPGDDDRTWDDMATCATLAKARELVKIIRHSDN